MKQRGKLVYILIALVCAVFGALGQLFLKLGSASISFDVMSWILNFDVVLGVIFYLIATFIFIMVLKNAELSLLYPVVATSYIWVALLSIFVLLESLSWINWLGFLLIIGGVFLTSIKQ